ncbi:MAG: hypothetical protein QGH40_02055, partial [bacterium]|nr:hypothetical protein [bacterium]
MENVTEYIKKNKVFLIILVVLLVAGLVGLKLKGSKKKKLGSLGKKSLASGGKKKVTRGKPGGKLVKATVSVDSLRPKDIKGGCKGLEEIGSLDIKNKELILKRIKVGFSYDYKKRYNPYRDWRTRTAKKTLDIIGGTKTLSEGQQQQAGAVSSGTPGASGETGGASGVSMPLGSSTGGQSAGGRAQADMSMLESGSDLDFSGEEGTSATSQASTVTLLYKGLFGLSRNKIAIIKEKSDVGEAVELKTEGEALSISGLVIQTIQSDRLILFNPRDGSLQELPITSQSDQSEEAEEKEEVEEAAAETKTETKTATQ